MPDLFICEMANECPRVTLNYDCKHAVPHVWDENECTPNDCIIGQGAWDVALGPCLPVKPVVTLACPHCGEHIVVSVDKAQGSETKGG